MTLEEIIRQYVKLGRPNGGGWHSCVHTGCDHGRKGPRAAFIFDGNGQVGFHCYNCATKTVYDPEAHSDMPDKMATILNDFGITPDMWAPVVFATFGKARIKKPKKDVTEIEPERRELPPEFVPLVNASGVMKELAVERLQERGIDPESYQFYLTESPKTLKDWYGRLVIPFYKNGRLIGWQGRDLTDTRKVRYINPPFAMDKVLYGFDRLFDFKDEPLLVVEGFFDAVPINGIAILGNDITPAQLKWLNKSPKQKIVIPDRRGLGKQLTQPALHTDNWAVATPDIGSCKDINQAVCKYGLLYVMTEIMSNIHSGFEAEVHISMYCKK